MKVTFVVLKQIEHLHLHAKFHLNVFILSASGSQKLQFWANFDFGGRLDRFILSPSGCEKPQFLDFGIY